MPSIAPPSHDDDDIEWHATTFALERAIISAFTCAFTYDSLFNREAIDEIGEAWRVWGQQVFSLLPDALASDQIHMLHWEPDSIPEPPLGTPNTALLWSRVLRRPPWHVTSRAEGGWWRYPDEHAPTDIVALRYGWAPIAMDGPYVLPTLIINNPSRYGLVANEPGGTRHFGSLVQPVFQRPPRR